MRRLTAAVCLTLVTAQAHAISRYTAASLSCAEIRAIIAREGAAIIDWPSARIPGLRRYDRFVASQSYCDVEKLAQTTFIPAGDTAACPVNQCTDWDFIKRD